MITNLTNITVVGSPDYYLELESGKSYGSVDLTRDSTTTDIQLITSKVFYRFKLTSGDPSYQGAGFYSLYSDNSQVLSAYMENGRIVFRLSNGPDYIDIGIINNLAGKLVLNHWYDLVIEHGYFGGAYYFKLYDSESGNELGNSSYAGSPIYFNISSWHLGFETSSAVRAVVHKDSKITIESTSEVVLDLSGIEWDPVPSVSSFGTTNAI